MSNKSISNSRKAFCSVSEMARILRLSRARFYQLTEKGKFPPAIYDIQTKRPYYNQDLQEICINIKNSNIAFDNTPMLFYSPRKKKAEDQNIPTPSKKVNPSKQLNPQYEDWVETLQQMGLRHVTYDQVETAVKELYAGDLPEDEGTILREIYQYIKKNIKNDV